MHRVDSPNIACTSPVVVALDFPDSQQALSMANRLDPMLCRVKVGKELYTRCGPGILESLHGMNFEVFLDLKFHDIPNTTSAAVGVAADLGVWMVNVHASGGKRMMEACANKLQMKSHRPKLIAVTVLTSMEQADLSDIGLDIAPDEQVRRLALLAQESGMDGVVCSSKEVSMLKAVCGSNFDLVTPGIRPESAAVDDQRRIMTPQQALSAGSDFLVIGRPITQAQDPGQSLKNILSELEAVSSADD